MRKQRLFVRNLQAGAQLQSFVVAAVAAILAIRLYLRLADYPQLGGAGLHIAHMLWGGLLMLAAIVILLSFVSKAAERWAAIIGGFGFGTFIDEVGKFVTSDNDYFFQPAIAIIYVTFVLLLLSMRAIHTGRNYTKQEYLVNALREMEEVALHDLDEEEQKRALLYLQRSEAGNPLVRALKNSLLRVDLQPAPAPWAGLRARQALRDFYYYLAHRSWFRGGVILFFIAQMLVKTSLVLSLIFFRDVRWGTWDARVVGRVVERAGNLSFIDWAEICSTALAGAFVLWGIWRMRRSWLAAFRAFERSVLVSILLTQVFVFYHEEFYALAGLIFNLLVLVTLRFIIGRERAAEAASAVKEAR